MSLNNRAFYILIGTLLKWLNNRNIKPLRGAPHYPMTQGEIERWHHTLKNRNLLSHGTIASCGFTYSMPCRHLTGAVINRLIAFSPLIRFKAQSF